MEKPYGLTMRGIAKKNNKILLLKRHPKSRTYPNKWEFPGGKVNPGEFWDDGLIREFKEETNLDIKLGDLYEAIQDDYSHKRTVQIVMNVEIISGKVKISDEHIDYKWVNFEDIKKIDISNALKKVLDKKNWKI